MVRCAENATKKLPNSAQEESIGIGVLNSEYITYLVGEEELSKTVNLLKAFFTKTISKMKRKSKEKIPHSAMES